MNTEKQKLAEWVEAYAAAKASGNRLLLEFTSSNLNALVQKLEIKEIKEPEPEPES